MELIWAVVVLAWLVILVMAFGLAGMLRQLRDLQVTLRNTGATTDRRVPESIRPQAGTSLQCCYSSMKTCTVCAEVAPAFGLLAAKAPVRPGHLPRPRAGHPQPAQRFTVHSRQQPPCGGIRGHRAEQVRLVPQDRQVGDRFATISDHHGQIRRDPAWIMAALPLPQPGQGFAERSGQTSGVSDIGQQPGTSVSDHRTSIRAHSDLRTGSGSLHLASAFRDGRSGPSTSQIIPDQKAFPHFRS